MSFLEKLGLGQKNKETAPLLGDNKKKAQENKSTRRGKYLRWLIFTFFLVSIVVSIPQGNYKQVANYTVGQPWRNDDLTAPFTFALNKTKQEIEQEIERIKEQTSPIFHIKANAEFIILNRLDSLETEIKPVLEAYARWQDGKQNPSNESFNDSLRFVQQFNQSPIELDQKSWDLLYSSYFENIYQQNNESQFILNAILNRLKVITGSLLNEGIINVSKNEINTNEITVRNLKESTERTVNIANVRDMREALEYTQFRLSRFFDNESVGIGLQIFRQSLIPNYIYNIEATQAKIQEAIDSISKTKGAIAQEQMIIRRGDIVTPEKANILESLAEARSQNASKKERWIRYGGVSIVTIVIAFTFFMYLFLYRRNIVNSTSNFLLLFLMLGIVIISAPFIFNIEEVSPYIIPIAIAPIVLTIIFDSRVGIMASYLLAIIVSFIIGNSFEFTVATVAACSLGVFSVRDIKNRAQFFFTTPGIVFVTYLIVITGFALASYQNWNEFASDVLMAGISSLFILFTYPIILLFEKIFGITTDFTLLELSDTNRPLLKKLMNTAPGTFHHSLQVANLAEAAASAIGANSLLCRVGSLYHDIGKMDKPEYFVENQGNSNEHENLKPRMSAIVIKAHVSEGVKMAREYNLPEVLIDFIKTHHGTSVIRYFYEKAKEDPQLKSEIQREDFRYDGPLPFTKETGIVLLADGIEAASRAMKDPTYHKLQNLVNRMVDERVNEGQLSNCPLTFRHLQVIKESFLTILAGVYHSRVEYPEDSDQKKTGSGEFKGAAEDGSQKQKAEHQ